MKLLFFNYIITISHLFVITKANKNVSCQGCHLVQEYRILDLVLNLFGPLFSNFESHSGHCVFRFGNDQCFGQN